MREVVIVDGVGTPIGKAGRDKGYYKDVRADDLAVNCIKRLLEKNPKLTLCIGIGQGIATVVEQV